MKTGVIKSKDINPTNLTASYYLEPFRHVDKALEVAERRLELATRRVQKLRKQREELEEQIANRNQLFGKTMWVCDRCGVHALEWPQDGAHTWGEGPGEALRPRIHDPTPEPIRVGDLKLCQDCVPSEDD